MRMGRTSRGQATAQTSKPHASGSARVLLRRLVVALTILDDPEFDVLLLVEEGVQPPNPCGLDLSLLRRRRGIITLALKALLVHELEFAHLGNELGDRRAVEEQSPRRESAGKGLGGFAGRRATLVWSLAPSSHTASLHVTPGNGV